MSTALSRSLKARLAFLLSDSIGFGIVGAINRLLGILVVPIIVRVLEVKEYGVVDGLRTMYVVIAGLTLWALQQAAARFIVEEPDRQEKAHIAGQAVIAALAISVTVGASMLPFAAIVGRVFLGIEAPDITRSIRLLAVTIPFWVFMAFCLMLLRWHFRRRSFIFLAVIETVLLLGFTYLTTVVYRHGVVGVFAAQLAAEVCAALIGFYLTRGLIARPQNFRRLGDLFRFASPLMIVSTLVNLQPMLERTLIVRFLGLTELGLYSVGQSFSRLAKLPADGFALAWQPFAMAVHDKPEANETFNAVLVIYLVSTGLLLMAFLAIAKPTLVLFASEKYLTAIAVLVPVTFGYFCEIAAGITGIGIFIAKRTYFSIVTYAAQLAVTFAGIYLLAEPYGIVGVAYAFLLGKLALLLAETGIGYAVSNLRYRLTLPITVGAFSLAGAILLSRNLWAAQP